MLAPVSGTIDTVPQDPRGGARGPALQPQQHTVLPTHFLFQSLLRGIFSVLGERQVYLSELVADLDAHFLLEVAVGG
jgi:hypothetical protein